MRELKIPQARVAVLIGEKGKTKKALEKKLKIKLKIGDEGDVVLSGDELDTYLSERIIKAIGRGFNPEVALSLTDEENALEIIDIKDFSGKSKKKLIRIKARVIGTDGKARKLIEKITDTEIVVYGKTVAIIGKIDNVFIARVAVEKLLGGSPHGHVYRYIEEEMKKRKWQ